jgi:hypothetical protein
MCGDVYHHMDTIKRNLKSAKTVEGRDVVINFNDKQNKA